MTDTVKTKIAIFGHYGNQNMGDEAIIEAAIRNVRERAPNSDIVCMSINPIDSATRHNVEAFPIRRRKHLDAKAIQPTEAIKVAGTDNPKPETANAPQQNQAKSFKQTLKAIPLLGFALKVMVRIIDEILNIADEFRFLAKGRSYLKDVDLLMITGSNQFLDNFGGAWGFPYTLFKWAMLARITNTKVAFVSVGAGPLNLPLSFFMLRIALKGADYVSYRDEGSKELIESRINIDAPVYPDVTHSLGYKPSFANTPKTGALTIGINPMPVYDVRYWHHPDADKFNDYVNKVFKLCIKVLEDGNNLLLFSTQSKDEDVIDDLISLLSQNEKYEQWKGSISISKCSQVSQLMTTIDKSDLIVATRFHATVLPLQLSKPTIGICYYRKAAELLDEFGLQDFHVDIDDFESSTLIKQYESLTQILDEASNKISQRFDTYTKLLDEQYSEILSLLSNKH